MWGRGVCFSAGGILTEASFSIRAIRGIREGEVASGWELWRRSGGEACEAVIVPRKNFSLFGENEFGCIKLYSGIFLITLKRSNCGGWVM